jgi:hypothetical protein
MNGKDLISLCRARCNPANPAIRKKKIDVCATLPLLAPLQRGSCIQKLDMTSARNQPKRRRRPRKSHKQNHDALIQAPVEALSQPHSQDSRLRFKELVR